MEKIIQALLKKQKENFISIELDNFSALYLITEENKDFLKTLQKEDFHYQNLTPEQLLYYTKNKVPAFHNLFFSKIFVQEVLNQSILDKHFFLDLRNVKDYLNENFYKSLTKEQKQDIAFSIFSDKSVAADLYKEKDIFLNYVKYNKDYILDFIEQHSDNKLENFQKKSLSVNDIIVEDNLQIFCSNLLQYYDQNNRENEELIFRMCIELNFNNLAKLFYKHCEEKYQPILDKVKDFFKRFNLKTTYNIKLDNYEMFDLKNPKSFLIFNNFENAENIIKNIDFSPFGFNLYLKILNSKSHYEIDILNNQIQHTWMEEYLIQLNSMIMTGRENTTEILEFTSNFFIVKEKMILDNVIEAPATMSKRTLKI